MQQQTDGILNLGTFLLSIARQRNDEIEAGLRAMAAPTTPPLREWCDGLAKFARSIEDLGNVLEEYEREVGWERDDLRLMQAELYDHLGVLAGRWPPEESPELVDPDDLHLGLALVTSLRLGREIDNSYEQLCEQLSLLEAK